MFTGFNAFVMYWHIVLSTYGGMLLHRVAQSKTLWMTAFRKNKKMTKGQSRVVEEMG